jgi:hypothetical protein
MAAKESVIRACARNLEIERTSRAQELRAAQNAAFAEYTKVFGASWPQEPARVLAARDRYRAARLAHERHLTAAGWTDADDRLLMAIFDD